jgi:PAS domain S-box-containing protein
LTEPINKLIIKKANMRKILIFLVILFCTHPGFTDETKLKVNLTDNALLVIPDENGNPSGLSTWVVHALLTSALLITTLLAATFVLRRKVASRTAQISEQNRQLKEARGDLESRVMERTRELAESEKKYYDLYENAPVMYASVDAKTAKIIQCNDTLLKATGYKRNEVVGLPIFEMYAPGSAEYARKKLFPTFTTIGSIQNEELQLRRKDGSAMDVLLNVSAVRDGEGNILHSRSVWRDISELKRLRQVQLLQSELAANMSEGVYMARCSDMTIVYANPKFEEMFGYDPGEMIGQHLSIINAPTKLTPEETVKVTMSEIEKGGGLWRGEVKNIKKDGTLFWCYISASVFNHHEYGKVVLEVSSDITDRKLLEERLKANQTQLDRIYNTTHELMALIEYDDNRCYRLADFNDAYWYHLQSIQPNVVKEQFKGVELDKIGSLLGLPDSPDLCWKYDNVRTSKQPVTLVEVAPSYTGDHYFETTVSPLFDSDDECTQFLYSSHEITGLKRAEEALRENEEFIRLVTDNVPGLISYVDKDMVYRFANKGYERWFGLKEEDIVGRKVEELLEPKAFNLSLPFIQSALKGEEVTFEGNIKLPDGSTKDFANHFVPHILADNSVAGYFVLVSDITELKRKEIVLRDTEERLRQSQKLESIGQLAGGVAHDFNNLLTTIIGYSEVISLNKGLDDVTKGGIQEIRNSADRATALTQQLLAFSRKQVMHPKQINLNELIQNTRKMLKRLIPENVSFETILGSHIDLIKADQGQIEQVLMNLAVNAVDAMPEGGSLTVETMNVRLEEGDQIYRQMAPGDYVELKVIDSGSGMDEWTLEQVFDPFFTTKEVGRGTGLGLATVYGIVKQSDGFIRVDSKLNHGSTFTVWFPAVVAEDRGIETASTDARKDSVGGDESILIVEDEEQIRKLAKLILNGQGYSIVEASNGTEAISMIEEAGYPPIDCLVTDVIMPEMGGKELSEKLLEKYPKVKTLYISGYERDSISHHGVLEKGTHFLEKPFSPQELISKIREMLDGD